MIGNVFEPTNFVGNISGDYTINSDGVYRLTGSANIIINAKNVKIIQEDPETEIENVYMTGPSGGGANLWIENLNAVNTSDGNIIKFQGTNNVLTFKGVNNFKSNNTQTKAIINAGKGLSVIGQKKDSELHITPSGESFGNGETSGAAIGSDASEDLSGTYIQVLQGKYTLTSEGGGSCIGSGVGGEIGSISVKNAVIEGGDASSRTFGAIIGAACSGFAGDIYIENSEIKTTTYDGGIGTGLNGKAGNIEIKNSKITADAWQGAGIGSGEAGEVEDIFVSSCTLNIHSNNGAGIGTGANASAGNIAIVNSNLNNVKSDNGENVGRGVNGRIKGSNVADDADTTEDGRPIVYGIDAPLIIHHGPHANQATKFYINDMHTKSLGTGRLLKDSLPTNDEDLARYDALSYDKNLQSDWLETLKSAQHKNLDKIDVITKKNANVAVRVIDGAIEYALNEATRIGSYLQRLDYTDSNLVVMNENVQAAESTIRDADMAKEMTEYTKFNVLTQSAQAMLAQANQNGSQVLSLLQ